MAAFITNTPTLPRKSLAFVEIGTQLLAGLPLPPIPIYSLTGYKAVWSAHAPAAIKNGMHAFSTLLWRQSSLHAHHGQKDSLKTSQWSLQCACNLCMNYASLYCMFQSIPIRPESSATTWLSLQKGFQR